MMMIKLMRMIFIDDDDYDEKGGWVQEWQSVSGQRPLSTVFPSTLQWSSSLLRFLCQGVVEQILFLESWSFLSKDTHPSLHTLHWSRTLRWSHEVLRFVQQSLFRLRWKRLLMQSWPIPVKFFKKRSWQGLWNQKFNFGHKPIRDKRKLKIFLWAIWRIFYHF